MIVVEDRGCCKNDQDDKASHVCGFFFIHRREYYERGVRGFLSPGHVLVYTINK